VPGVGSVGSRIVDSQQTAAYIRREIAPPPMSTAALADPIRLYQGSTLANLVSERLAQKIGNGDLQPGERLNEVALAGELGVSRGPIREAIRILERKDLVSVVANRGAFVRRIDRDDMVDLYRLRAVITGLACQLAAERADAGTVEALQKQVADMDAAARSGDRDRYYALNLAFHELLVQASGSARVRTLNEQLVNQAHLFRRGSLLQAADMTQSNKEHRQIVAAIAAHDAERARQLGEAHVGAGWRRFDAKQTEPRPAPAKAR
jgi:DNA-binding GntR family transcriptional regulator